MDEDPRSVHYRGKGKLALARVKETDRYVETFDIMLLLLLSKKHPRVRLHDDVSNVDEFHAVRHIHDVD